MVNIVRYGKQWRKEMGQSGKLKREQNPLTENMILNFRSLEIRSIVSGMRTMGQRNPSGLP
jgi:hypothetical protein